ncbi:MAG: class I SAM-dependent methyltransferase [Clostridiales Family XIII bacterium]|nr:class I SAM-dependent methyltransferase [Clostridiales Family XIII bacterium]
MKDTHNTRPPKPYDDRFYIGQKDNSYASARTMLGYVISKLHPSSVLDIGCGVGTWCRAALDCGVTDITGVDGEYVDRSLLYIDENHFVPHDLTKELRLGRKFDLAVSLEVAEHIDEEFSDMFIQNICQHADIILFSAAPPRQGGTEHVNEQPLSYWQKKFLMHDYIFVDGLRGHFWNDSSIEAWYRQNAVLVVKQSEYGRISALFPEEHPLDIIHPESYRVKLDIESNASKHLISRQYIIKNHPRITAFFAQWRKRINHE